MTSPSTSLPISWARFIPLFIFASHPVGSLGGILAIRNGICHMAGLHLLDPETGEYNFPYLRQYLKGIDVRVIHLVYREQGLMFRREIPKAIQGLKDLTRQGDHLYQPSERFRDKDSPRSCVENTFPEARGYPGI